VLRFFRSLHPESYGCTGVKPRLCAQPLHTGEIQLLRIVLNVEGGRQSVSNRPLAEEFRNQLVEAHPPDHSSSSMHIWPRGRSPPRTPCGPKLVRNVSRPKGDDGTQPFVIVVDLSVPLCPMRFRRPTRWTGGWLGRFAVVVKLGEHPVHRRTADAERGRDREDRIKEAARDCRLPESPVPAKPAQAAARSEPGLARSTAAVQRATTGHLQVE
jgi:hypothetical protein